MKMYVFDKEDDLIVTTTSEDAARRVAGYYDGYILTEADMQALYE